MVRWVVVVVLAGCGKVPIGPVERLVADRCGVALVAGLVGQPFEALAEVDLPGPLRVLYPGQEVVERQQAGRLSVRVDGEERIRSVFCG